MTDSRVASLAALLRELARTETLQDVFSSAHESAQWLVDRGVTVGSRLGEPSRAEMDALAREVWKSWRTGMAVQNRPVAVERTSWDTLSAEDRELDHYIAGWLLSFLNYKSGVRAGSEETPQ